MKNQDYLDRNLRELFKSVEPQLHMPADRRAEVLDQLLQEAEMSTEYERTRIPWIKLAVAATVLLAVVLGSYGNRASISSRTSTPMPGPFGTTT